MGASWGTPSNVVYSTDNSASTALFDRVGYRMQLDSSYVWVEAKAFTGERTKLGVPSDWIWDLPLTDLSVRTNASNVTAESHVSGNMEFWSNCYSPGLNGVYDYDDDIDSTDCYGSMQIFDGQNTVFALNNWVGGGQIDIGIGNNTGNQHPDWTFMNNASNYGQRRLEIYVHELTDCSSDPCVHGTCNASASPIACACAAAYGGALCDQCALGYADLNHDGTCLPACVTGPCDGLQAVRGLGTGVHDLNLDGVGAIPVFVDNSYDGGGWILIGRGRENWTWNNAGIGGPDEVSLDVGTTAAFTPKYLSTAIIEQLINSTPGNLDLTKLDVRISRAAATDGSSYQQVHWSFPYNPQWDWDFENQQQTINAVIDDSVLGLGMTFGSNARDLWSGHNDQTRVFTWAWGGHNNEQGFSYGQAINFGDSSPTNFLWEYSGEDHAMPYSEVYIRAPICRPNTCNGHGTCSDLSGPPTCTCSAGYAGKACDSCDAGYQDNDSNDTCELACSSSSCPTPGQGCIDVSGSIQCMPVSGSSCLDIHNNHPSYGDGSYVVDPDELGGPAQPFGVICDMNTSGGGWTVISFEDFENGNARGWSDNRVDTSSDCVGVYTRTLGGYGLFGGGADTQRTFDLRGIAHTESYVSLDYLSIDSWDGELGIVRVDGSDIYDTNFYYSDGTGMCGGGWNDRSPQPVVSQNGHNANQLTLEITSGLDQDPYDESFAADNVKVMIR